MQPNVPGVPYPGVIQQPPMMMPMQMQNPLGGAGMGTMPFGMFSSMPVMQPHMAQMPAMRPPMMPMRPQMMHIPSSTGPDMLNVGKPAAGVKPTSADDFNAVFVGHISADVEDEFLRGLLQECGRIVKWNRPPDPTTNRLASFGFCQFESPQGVLFATRILHNINLEGKQLMVKANEKSQVAMDKWKIERRDLVRQHQIAAGKTPDEIKDLDEELNQEEERAKKVVYEKVDERRKQYRASLGGDERTLDGQDKASLVESEIAAFRCSLVHRDRASDDRDRPAREETEETTSAVSKNYRESWREREREQHYWERERLADKEFLRRERDAEKDEERRLTHRKRMFERIEDDARHRRRTIHRELKESSENEKWKSSFHQSERKRKREREKRDDAADMAAEEAELKAKEEAEEKAALEAVEIEKTAMEKEDFKWEAKLEETRIELENMPKVELGFAIPPEKQKAPVPRQEVSALFGDNFVEEERPKHKPLQKLDNLLDRGNIKAATQIKHQQLEMTKRGC
eukprot:Platyproteum_vivax@DN6376_c0_g1_i1.p1